MTGRWVVCSTVAVSIHSSIPPEIRRLHHGWTLFVSASYGERLDNLRRCPAMKWPLASNCWASTDTLIRTSESVVYMMNQILTYEKRDRSTMPNITVMQARMEYSDREDCAIGIDRIRYGWLYTQISNMTRGLAGISRSGWIITSKVLITHEISHTNLHGRHTLYVERYRSDEVKTG